jgi:methionyl-tRNA formyltransferase
MRIDAGLDTGDMLLKAQTEIGPEENAIELGQRLAVMGADLLVETMAGLAADTIVAEKQDASQATLAPILKKEDGLIDWALDAEKIRNRMRGLQPWPGTYTTFRGRTLHVWKAVEQAILPAMPAIMPAHFVSLKPLVVKCGEGALELLEVQLEGRKRISAADFANGHRLTENDILGIAK